MLLYSYSMVLHQELSNLSATKLGGFSGTHNQSDSNISLGLMAGATNSKHISSLSTEMTSVSIFC